MDILDIPTQLSKASNKDKPWETHRMVADSVQRIFLSSSDQKQVRRGERVGECAPYLIFKLLENPDSEEIKHKLRFAQFCRVRLCPTCMWRKSMAWRARFYQAWPKIQEEYKSARYFHLVLTVPNCEVSDLRSVMDRMNKAWKKMADRKSWPAIGFLRSMEVTRSKKGESHPHIHALMMVKGSYFNGKNYMSREQWRDYWASALGVPKESIIHPYVRSVKRVDDVSKVVLEVAKYAVKTKSMASILRHKPGQKWFLELDKQLSGTKSVTLGGVLKKALNNDEISDEEMIQHDKEEFKKFLKDVRYDWFSDKKAYLRTKVLNQDESNFWDKKEKDWEIKTKNGHKIVRGLLFDLGLDFQNSG